MKTATNMFATALIIVLMMLVSSSAIYAANYTQQDVDKALAGLKSNDLVEKTDAVNFFVENAGITEAYDTLVNGLNDTFPPFRRYCAMAIAEYKNRDRIPVLENYLNKSIERGKNATIDADEIYTAINCIARIGGDAADKIVSKCLKSENLTVRNSATKVVALTTKDVAKVTPYINDADKQTRYTMYETLGWMRTPAAFDILQNLFAQKKDAEETLVIMRAIQFTQDARSVDIYINALKNDDPDIRANAAIILFTSRDDKVVDALIEALTKDKDASVRMCIVNSLRYNKNEKVVPALIVSMQDTNAGVRASVASAIGERTNIAFYEKRDITAERTAFKPLLALLNDEAGIVSASAAQALAAFNDKEAIDPLIKALRNDFNRTRSNAVTSLFAIGGDKVMDAIGLAMGRELDHTVLRSMIAVMKQMTDKETAAKYIEAAAKNARKDNQKLESEFVGAHLALVGNTTGMK